jgi:hypothetical protein
MSGECSTNGRGEERVEVIDGKARMKEITREIKTWVGE